MWELLISLIVAVFLLLFCFALSIFPFKAMKIINDSRECPEMNRDRLCLSTISSSGLSRYVFMCGSYVDINNQSKNSKILDLFQLSATLQNKEVEKDIHMFLLSYL